MRARARLNIDDVLVRPWIISGLTLAVVVLALLAAHVLPWEETRQTVAVTELPVVRHVRYWDRERDAQLVLSIDAAGAIWSGTTRIENVEERVRSFRRESRREGLMDDGSAVFGEVNLRVHCRSSWRALRRVLIAALDVGFDHVVLQCRRAEHWGGSPAELWVELLEAERVPELEDDEEWDEPQGRRERRRIEVRSVDVASADRDRERLAAERRANVDYVHPAVDFTCPPDTDAQSVFAVWDCYAGIDDDCVGLVGLR